jgi:hypothetical protein
LGGGEPIGAQYLVPGWTTDVMTATLALDGEPGAAVALSEESMLTLVKSSQ